jgi:divalent metal cation (Fe/Co/Zn/Cd) transporter
MKDNLFWPGFILLVVAFSGMISATAAAAYGHYEWLPTTVLVAALGTVAAALWFVVEVRRVTRIDEQWHAGDADAPPRQRAAS